MKVDFLILYIILSQELVQMNPYNANVMMRDCIRLKRTNSFFSSEVLNEGHRKKMVQFFVCAA